MELGTVIDALYASEINCSIASFWDGGIVVKLGDVMNGFRAERECATAAEAPSSLTAPPVSITLDLPTHLARRNGNGATRD